MSEHEKKIAELERKLQTTVHLYDLRTNEANALHRRAQHAEGRLARLMRAVERSTLGTLFPPSSKLSSTWEAPASGGVEEYVRTSGYPRRNLFQIPSTIAAILRNRTSQGAKWRTELRELRAQCLTFQPGPLPEKAETGDAVVVMGPGPTDQPLVYEWHAESGEARWHDCEFRRFKHEEEPAGYVWCWIRRARTVRVITKAEVREVGISRDGSMGLGGTVLASHQEPAPVTHLVQAPWREGVGTRTRVIAATPVFAERADDLITKHLTAQGPRTQIKPDTDLGRVMDSVEMMELVVWIGDQFGFDVEIDDITPDNFSSPEKLARYVEGKRTR